MDFVYQIDNLLTPEECQKYMDMFKNKPTYFIWILF